jgi:hypothetical protein
MELFDHGDVDSIHSVNTSAMCGRTMGWTAKETAVQRGTHERPLKSLVELANGDKYSIPCCDSTVSCLNQVRSNFVAMRCGELFYTLYSYI